MNNDLMFSSMRDDWETPDALFQKYHRKYNFTRDVCANSKNHKLPEYFSPECDAFRFVWHGRCWMNPPYGRNVTGKWMQKAMMSVHLGQAELVCCLVPARTDTKWFHQYVWDKWLNQPRVGVDIEFLEGRIKFLVDGVSKDPAPFPSMIVIYS